MSNSGPSASTTPNRVGVNVELDASGKPTGQFYAGGTAANLAPLTKDSNGNVTGFTDPATGTKYAALPLDPNAKVMAAKVLRQKTVWYRMRHQGGTVLQDAMGNGPDMTINGTTTGIWGTAKRFTCQGNNYCLTIGNAYLDALFAMQTLQASQGILFFAADFYAASATPAATQTIFQYGTGTGAAGNHQGLAFSQHITQGFGRVRFNDEGTTINPIAVTAQLTASARSALCGYIDFLNQTVGVSLNGGAFTTTAFGGTPTLSDATAASYGLMAFALNATGPTNVPPPITPNTFMLANAQVTGLFITRFDTHPGLDFINQLATDFNDAAGVFPDDLRTGAF